MFWKTNPAKMVGAERKVRCAPGCGRAPGRVFAQYLPTFDVLAKKFNRCVLPVVMRWLQQLGF
jgi:hypothetical protein